MLQQVIGRECSSQGWGSHRKSQRARDCVKHPPTGEETSKQGQARTGFTACGAAAPPQLPPPPLLSRRGRALTPSHRAPQTPSPP